MSLGRNKQTMKTVCSKGLCMAGRSGSPGQRLRVVAGENGGGGRTSMWEERKREIKTANCPLGFNQSAEIFSFDRDV